MTLQHQELLYRISDGEVKMAAITHDVGKGIKFSYVPYKLCEGAECAFPQGQKNLKLRVAESLEEVGHEQRFLD